MRDGITVVVRLYALLVILPKNKKREKIKKLRLVFAVHFRTFQRKILRFNFHAISFQPEKNPFFSPSIFILSKIPTTPNRFHNLRI